MDLVCVLGARPNVIKAAPLIQALKIKGHNVKIIHTGQHYDENMFGAFLRTFALGPPDYSLEVSDIDRTTRMAEMIDGLGSVLRMVNPRACIVVGDVDSTLAGALAAHLTKTPIIHLEAGLRSYDQTMPEETNRFLTDHLSEVLLTTTQEAVDNLTREALRKAKVVRFVGNTMIDSLITTNFSPTTTLTPYHPYILCTFHREYLFEADGGKHINELVWALEKICDLAPVFIVGHPRWKKINLTPTKLVLLPPQSYYSFIRMLNGADLVITDSGGVQEETAFLNKPCLIYRDNTERKITITQGSNKLIGINPGKLVKEVFNGSWRGLASKNPIDKWDGHAAERAVDTIEYWSQL